MKLLFLDWDGVANNHTKHPNSVYCGSTPSCVAQLNRVIAATACLIVVTSAWRYQVHRGDSTVRGLEYLFLTHGLLPMDASGSLGRLHSVTCKDSPNLDFSDPKLGCRERVRQIRAHAVAYRLLPQDYAVVDDLPLEFGPLVNFVRTDGTVGLTAADADRLIEMLGGNR